MPKRHILYHIGRLALWCAILAGVIFGVVTWKRQAIVAKYADVTKPVPPVPSVVTKEQVAAIEKLPAEKVEEVLPKTFNLDVPFIKQAPLGVWDHLHNETCEEASVLAVHAYYKKLRLDDNQVEAELLKIVALEKKLFGYFEDTNVSKTAQFAKAMYKFKKSRVLEKPTVEEIKKEIFAGRPVLLPADGKALKNPNFRNGGPPYHFIVLRGWNEQGFFTNDPGTKKGENYFYTTSIIMKAMHDWNEVDLKANGQARVLVLEK